MKTLLSAVPIVLLFAGCSTRYGWMNRSSPPAAKGSQTVTPQANVAPASSANGKIASVRPDLKFVVVDFSPGGLPQIGRRMTVYRDSKKVGEVTISGPVIDSNIAADIVAGTVQVGDAVRDH